LLLFSIEMTKNILTLLSTISLSWENIYCLLL
jgi:hypothetical protein